MVAAAVIGSAVVGTAVSSDASRSAANKQKDALNNATKTSNDQYLQTREDMTPWREAGTVALKQLSDGTYAPDGEFNKKFTLADFNQDPGYQFRLGQGMSGVEKSAAARGGLLNGGTLKALNRYNQDYASGEYQNAYNRFNNDQTSRFNRLASVAGIGQTATRDVAQMGAQNAQYVGNAQISAGNASAAGTVGQANAINGGLTTLGNWYQQRSLMSGLGSGQSGSLFMPQSQGAGATPWAGSDYGTMMDVG